jgi:hypothetical protein
MKNHVMFEVMAMNMKIMIQEEQKKERKEKRKNLLK